MDIIDEYIAFKNMAEKPPKDLLLGEVKNIYSIHRLEYDGISSHQTDTRSTALSHFLDGYSTLPRVFHIEHAPLNTPELSVPNTDVMLQYYYKCPSKTYSMSSSMQELMSVATPAPFGDLRTGTTMHDKEVRDCYQITQDSLGDCTITRDLSDTICKSIESTLFPNQHITIQFNKINIYRTGGHFKRHVDTPKPNVIGTVVVFGDSKFNGGDLVIDDDGHERRFHHGIVAFYSNTPHWIEPVTSGIRITATYYILQSTEAEATDVPRSQTETSSKVIDILQKSKFGVVLSETYSKSESNALKGTDRNLTDLLPYFKIEYVPVLVAYTESYDEDMDDEASDGSFRARVYRCTEDDFICYKNGDTYSPRADDYLDCYISPKLDKIGGHRVHDFSQPYIDHVGNECQEGIINNTYLSRLAILTPLQNLA